MKDFGDDLLLLGDAFWPLFTVLTVALLLETLAPWRRTVLPGKALRWLQAASLYLLGVLLVHVAVPLAQIAASVRADAGGVGLFHHVSAPQWFAVIVSLLALDFGDYVRHRVQHRFDLLWRAHRVHHSETQVDASTALKFHPLETLLTVLVAVSIIFLIGAPPIAAVIHASLIVVLGVWGHANIHTPRFTRLLLPVFVTPEMHRCHHGDRAVEMSSNFGIIFSIWDRMFGTYKAPQPIIDSIRFGLGPGSTLRFDTLGRMLVDPLRSERDEETETSPSATASGRAP